MVAGGFCARYSKSVNHQPGNANQEPGDRIAQMIIADIDLKREGGGAVCVAGASPLTQRHACRVDDGLAGAAAPHAAASPAGRTRTRGFSRCRLSGEELPPQFASLDIDADHAFHGHSLLPWGSPADAGGGVFLCRSLHPAAIDQHVFYAQPGVCHRERRQYAVAHLLLEVARQWRRAPCRSRTLPVTMTLCHSFFAVRRADRRAEPSAAARLRLLDIGKQRGFPLKPLQLPEAEGLKTSSR